MKSFMNCLQAQDDIQSLHHFWLNWLKVSLTNGINSISHLCNNSTIFLSLDLMKSSISDISKNIDSCFKNSGIRSDGDLPAYCSPIFLGLMFAPFDFRNSDSIF